MQTSTSKRLDLSKTSSLISDQHHLNPEQALAIGQEYRWILQCDRDNDPNGFIYFLFKYCRTLDFDDFAFVQNRKPNQPTFRTLPKKAYIRDIAKLIFHAPTWGPALIIGKSRQVSASWIIQCYVVYCLIFRENQRIAWTNLKLEQSQAAIKRIIKIFQFLTIPYPRIEYNKSEIFVTDPDPKDDLNNYLKAMPKGETALTSEAFSIWIPDEFSKLNPTKLQDEIWKEASICVHGQILIPSTANPNCLFQAFYQEPSV